MNKSVPKPWEFPLATAKSRAAARMLAQQKEEQRGQIEFVSRVQRPRRDNSKPHATRWTDTVDGRRIRVLYVPEGMTAAEARRIVDPASLSEAD